MKLKNWKNHNHTRRASELAKKYQAFVPREAIEDGRIILVRRFNGKGYENAEMREILNISRQNFQSALKESSGIKDIEEQIQRNIEKHEVGMRL